MPFDLDDIVAGFLRFTSDPIMISHRPAGGEPGLVWVNDAFCELGLHERDAVLGANPYDILHHPDYKDDFAEAVSSAVDSGRNRSGLETKCVRADGSEFWANIALSVIPDGNGGRYAIVAVRDIDSLKNREQSAELALIERDRLVEDLRAAQQRLASAINSIPDPFAIYDSSDRLVHWNDAYARSTAAEPDCLRAGMSVKDVLRIALQDGLFAVPEDMSDEDFARQGQSWITHQEPIDLAMSDGTHYRVYRSLAPNGDTAVLRVEVTEMLRQQRELKTYAERLRRANLDMSHQAQHDELTGLGNRRYLGARLDDLIAERREIGGELAVLHLDLDYFKQINDTMGHAAGDEVLKAVAARLRDGVRDTDVIARIGGDEFVVLMRIPEAGAGPEALAERLQRDLPAPVLHDGRPCLFGVSIGIAKTPVIEPGDLLTCSDVALYKAKNLGRSRAASFDHLDLENMRETKRLADDILRGLEQSEFVPFYQPQVDALTGDIVSFETLARWHHPERGLLAPRDFLSIASEMRIDGQIDAAIFSRAMAECGTLFETCERVPGLSFNVSLPRVMDPALAEVVYAVEEYPGKVAFELLETIFLEEETDEFLMRIDALRDIGLSLEVDDFGSGRASIVALKRIAPERLKIDRRLITPITGSESARKLVRAIVDIGQALGIGVTAEGVETAEHARMLADFGCDQLQGFHFAAPMPFADMAQLVAAAQNRRRQA